MEIARRKGDQDEEGRRSEKSLNKDYQESKEVPPLHLTEIVAYLVRQSGPFLDQLGIRRDLCDKLVEMLCSKRNGRLMYHSLSQDRPLAENITDELDLRIARVLESTGYHTDEGSWNDPAKYKISDNRRHVAIVTTASLPWMTGTAINPLFRAAYLARSAKQKVTLVVPWLSKSDQELVYPNNITFSSPEEQETYIRNWLQERIGFEANFKISFYPGKVLRLSAATQDLPRSVVCNAYMLIGSVDRRSFLRAYFLGKMVWAKGYRELIDLLSKHKNDLEGFMIDVYGNGEDSEAVQNAARKFDLSINFFKEKDHADDSLHGYKVFVNPSVSDVLCTATAEALAMGKFVVCADHPSNDFFKSFPNCLTYRTSEEFVARVKEAMTTEPQPLTPEQRYSLSWEAATERFMEYSELDKVLNRNSHPGRNGKINKERKIPLLPKLSDVVDGDWHLLITA
ncbi:unnamed protein product [Miscanthus lutarioriparius]|uniref:digalactosyldiacylglycerol synthase n=1 Tax=Miscanthus lutarioriparius TaxID=422564 RepID=A0A811QPD1_9POAL|nr:unnamed protein product [Miscanthus lutarioriparius]